MSARGWTGLTAAAVLVVAAAVAGVARDSGDLPGEQPVSDYLATPVPPGLDTLATLWDVAEQMEACSDPDGASCPGLVYVWSPLLPLSRAGITHIASAARSLELPLTVVGGSELYAPDQEDRDLAARLTATGATVHYPAVLVHRGSRIVGPAILGYKTAETYLGMIRERLTAPEMAAREVGTPEAGVPEAESAATPQTAYEDLPLPGRPGVYFRGVPGTRLLAYEAARQIHLLDLDDGAVLEAPGYVDFIPSPDGRFFVTPGPGRTGLEFYHAADVIQEGEEAEPFFTDPTMRDQYPSVGVLSRDGDRGDATVYRVLTSWYDRVVFRDYRIIFPGGRPRIWPLGDPVPACSNLQVSLPIMTRDGQELAGRNEATGTTTLFGVRADGTCTTLLDLGVPTSKVGFSADGRRVAFGIPRGAVTDGRGRRVPGAGGVSGDEMSGIFILDRDRGRTTRVPWSDAATPLAFPDFLDDGRLVFLIPAGGGEPARFRLVDLPDPSGDL